MCACTITTLQTYLILFLGNARISSDEDVLLRGDYRTLAGGEKKMVFTQCGGGIVIVGVVIVSAASVRVISGPDSDSHSWKG